MAFSKLSPTDFLLLKAFGLFYHPGGRCECRIFLLSFLFLHIPWGAKGIKNHPLHNGQNDRFCSSLIREARAGAEHSSKQGCFRDTLSNLEITQKNPLVVSHSVASVSFLNSLPPSLGFGVSCAGGSRDGDEVGRAWSTESKFG